MSAIGAWIWGTSQLDDAVDKATSELLPAGGEDIALNLEICDQIRSKSVPAKDAMRALKRRLNHKNPNVQLLALGLTDICIKNGGDLFLSEIASRDFMDNLVSILKIPALNHDVKLNILRMIQNWSVAFEGKSNLYYVGQVFKTLTNEGYKFPPKDLAVANSAMVDTQTAPEWIDSEVCLRCRTPFSFTNRKHHCRNCGQVFDQACSSKIMALPHFGITQEVRVCDGCHSKLIKKSERADKVHRHSTSLHGHRHRSARELADAELQRAIQLSLQEVNGTSGHARPGYVPSQPSPSTWGYSEPPIVDRTTYPADRKSAPAEDEEDPDLKAAIEASLREANAPRPSAPIGLETPREEQSYSFAGPGYSQSYPSAMNQQIVPKIPTYDLEPLEADVILTFNQTVEQVQAQGGRDISRYPAVTELYDKANGLRPKLALGLDDAGRKEEMLSNMHDQLSQAVKLYDQILSQQVAQPRWRAQQSPVVSPGPYQTYNTNYAPVDGYNQWTPQAQATQTGYQASQGPQREPSSPHHAFSSPPVVSTQLPQYGLASRPEHSQHQWQQQQQQQSQLHQSHPQQVQYAQPSSPRAPDMIPAQPPDQYVQRPGTQYQQYAAAPTSSTSQNAASYAYNQHQSIPSSSMQNTPAYAPPVALPQSPPPPPAQYQLSTPQAPPFQAPLTPSLARHSSVSHASSPPASHLARSNTVTSHAPSQLQQHQQYQTPLQLQQPLQQQQPQRQSYQVSSPPPAPVALPQFPAAPTSVPQPAYSAYAPSMPSGFEQKEERKEALLIDL
ncbi:hypothetical protein B0H34DRAFT_685525 [Crassisporium funariophilum]|nr:hypothetical protein B0H34DRAFT_685525 [Crassisporium funariophilum]